MIQIIIAAILLIAIVIAMGYAHTKTPLNLRGYYGKSNLIIAGIGILAIVALVISGILSLLGII